MFTPPPSIFTIWFFQFININTKKKKKLLWQSKWMELPEQAWGNTHNLTNHFL